MLQLKDIVKNYAAGENTVRALQGISLQFRRNEFVSILGPSGCGKTTMLNIIGGLDKYTSGDLVINGRSTKNYKDRDWDAYRNHSVGFVFQSYNLIPHQSVLQNVEIALSLSGVPKRERRQRAKIALEKVGLGDQLHKRPSQMSGGQMQRVAIARALVNDPDIILADEPTGALDTETSVQVMEILKEVAKDRLVIMVTHNPDLANTYSTRIIRMLDGVITSDSMPLTAVEQQEMQAQEQAVKAAGKTKRERKPTLSWTTSFGLSLKNLITKKGRTTLTAFAGSIGIIGIALIFAVSNGMNSFINAVQEDTLSSYPLTLEATTVDITTLMETFMGVASDSEEHDKDAIYSQSVLAKMLNALNNMDSMENDLKAFKAYLEQELKKAGEDNALKQALTGIQYTYNMDLLVYTKDLDGNIIYSDSEKLMMEAIRDYMGMDLSAMMNMGQGMSGGMAMTMPSMRQKMWCEILAGENGKPVNSVLEDQYDVIYGSWPNSYDEIVLIVDENNELDDMTLYAMGLETEEHVKAVFEAVLAGKTIETEQRKWTYEEICAMDFRVILNGNCFSLDEDTGLYTDLRESESGLRYLYDNALKLKVTGIIRPSEKATSTMLTGSIAYTKALTEYVAEQNRESAALNAQKAQTGTDIFTGLPFRNNENLTDADKEAAFRAHIAGLATVEEQAAAFVKIMSVLPADRLEAMVNQQMTGMTRDKMQEIMIAALSQQAGMNQEQMIAYITGMSDEDLESMFRQMMAEEIKKQYAQQVQQSTAMMTPAQLAGALQMALPNYTTEQCVMYYDAVLEFSESTYEENLRLLSDVDLDDPATINLYASTFENKDIIEQVIADYNATVDELKQIHYTDYVGIMMSSITTIINAITYVLIAFVAISLVVSSIMIGVITLISVQERTKEIGILRAIGASKKNVSGMFNAETVLIGFASGLLGVGVTYVLCAIVNVILLALTGLPGLKAVLPLSVAVVLIAISVLLTLLSGIIPSRSAAKKDPVVALRTE